MNQNRPAISAIIPCFNVESYIDETMASVLAQTYPPDEIILVDDCSSDRTLDLIREYAARDARVKVIALHTNQGVSAARNAGLALAKGDYIAMLDADDVWAPDALEVRAELAQRFDNADVIATDFAWFQTDLPLRPVGRVGMGPRGARAFAASFQSSQPVLLDKPFDAVATVHFAWTGATLVKRTAMQSVGNFDCYFQGPEDTLLWLRLAARGSFVFSPRITAYYRQREGSLVALLKGPKELHYLKVLNRLGENPEYLCHRNTISRLIGECHHVSAMHYREVGNREEAWKHLMTAVRLQPANFGYWRNVLTWKTGWR
jgi:glycosyltransferase involved in cell wall biosynthesis